MMRLYQVVSVDIVAIDAKRRNRLGQVIVEFHVASLARLMHVVAGGAAHIERRMTAAILGNVQALGVALRQRFWSFIALGELQQLKLVVRLVRIVTLDAVAHRGRMNCALHVRGIFIGVTGETTRFGVAVISLIG